MCFVPLVAHYENRDSRIKGYLAYLFLDYSDYSKTMNTSFGAEK